MRSRCELRAAGFLISHAEDDDDDDFNQRAYLTCLIGRFSLAAAAAAAATEAAVMNANGRPKR